MVSEVTTHRNDAQFHMPMRLLSEPPCGARDMVCLSHDRLLVVHLLSSVLIGTVEMGLHT